MATNPMQRKARNSFLLGMFITTIIAALIIGLLLYKFMELKKEQEVAVIEAAVLITDVTSGGQVTVAEVQKQEIPALNAPSDYIKFNELSVSELVAKIDLTKGTVLSTSMLSESDNLITNDVRVQEYNTIVLPKHLETGEYVDIRLVLPSGEDFIVTSKKEVVNTDADTVWLRMSEDETLIISNAIVESYIMTGSKLYAVTYVEPGMQEKAIPTYVPSGEVTTLMSEDPNITQTAIAAINERHTQALINLRESRINGWKDAYAEDSLANVEKHIEDEIAKRQEARLQYMEALEAGV